MKAFLVHQGLSVAIDEKALAALEEKEKEKASKLVLKAHSVILLSLGDEVLQEVSEEMTALRIRARLEALYMNKFLVNRLYLKKRLHTLSVEE